MKDMTGLMEVCLDNEIFYNEFETKGIFKESSDQVDYFFNGLKNFFSKILDFIKRIKDLIVSVLYKGYMKVMDRFDTMASKSKRGKLIDPSVVSVKVDSYETDKISELVSKNSEIYDKYEKIYNTLENSNDMNSIDMGKNEINLINTDEVVCSSLNSNLVKTKIEVTQEVNKSNIKTMPKIRKEIDKYKMNFKNFERNFKKFKKDSEIEMDFYKEDADKNAANIKTSLAKSSLIQNIFNKMTIVNTKILNLLANKINNIKKQTLEFSKLYRVK